MKDIYDELSPRDKERANMLDHVIMERIKNGEDPFKGKIIKAGTYAYNAKTAEEEKINAILEKISPSIKDEVEKLLEDQRKMEEDQKQLQDKLLGEVLKMTAAQTRVDDCAKSAETSEKDDEAR